MPGANKDLKDMTDYEVADAIRGMGTDKTFLYTADLKALTKLVGQLRQQGRDEGRREALASLNVPGAPLTPLCLEMLEHTVDAMCESARAGVVVPEELVSNLRHVFDHVRYLQGPILDALGHGELDQYRAGLEEGKRVREVWIASQGYTTEEAWSMAFETKDLAVQAVIDKAVEDDNDISSWERLDSKDSVRWGNSYMWYHVGMMEIHGEET